MGPSMAAEGSPDRTPEDEQARLPPMSRYVLGVYRRAPGMPAPSEADASRLQEGHLAHLRKLREAGELITSGPLEEGGTLRGIGIFSRSSTAEVRRLTADDPLLRAGYLELDLYVWFAPAGLRLAAPPASPPDLTFESD
jgi:uncharacterized protein